MLSRMKLSILNFGYQTVLHEIDCVGVMGQVIICLFYIERSAEGVGELSAS